MSTRATSVANVGNDRLDRSSASIMENGIRGAVDFMTAPVINVDQPTILLTTARDYPSKI